jgi:hypothetical protein
MGPKAAAAKLDIDVNLAQSITSTFYRKFNNVSKWINETKRLANYFDALVLYIFILTR